MKLIAALLLTVFASSAFAANIVDFRIAAGTGEGAWNTQLTSIEATVGDTIRFYNDDTIVHQLHTFGSPCSHGPQIAPGHYWDCHTGSPYSAATEGPLYDHAFGDTAQVWLEVVAQ